MVLEEFQNIMLSVYIFVDFFFLNGLQKSTDRIFRLECQLCWLPVVTFYKYHILGKHWHKPQKEYNFHVFGCAISRNHMQCFPNHPIAIQSSEGYTIVENIDIKCNIFPAIPQIVNDFKNITSWKTLKPNASFFSQQSHRESMI